MTELSELPNGFSLFPMFKHADRISSDFANLVGIFFLSTSPNRLDDTTNHTVSIIKTENRQNMKKYEIIQ